MRLSLVLSVFFIFNFSNAAVNAHASPSSQENLQRRNREMIWPKGLDPSMADAFNHNQLRMAQSCDVIYSWLSAPQSWPNWLIFVKDVKLAKPSERLRVSSRFKWTIFGYPIEAEIYVFEPGRSLGFTVTPPGPPPQYAQSWHLKVDGKGCVVTIEEVGVGEMARQASKNGDPLVYLAHELWLASLHFVSRTGAHPVK